MYMYAEEIFLLSLIGRDFVFSRLAGNGEEERKIHALAFENFQRTNGMNEIGKNQRKTIWYAQIKNVLIKQDVKIWSKRGYK